MAVVLLALFALLTHWAAWRHHFFKIPSRSTLPIGGIVASGFGVYLGFSFLIAPLTAKLMSSYIEDPIALVSYLQFFIFGTLTLILFLIGIANRAKLQTIWKNSNTPMTTDIGMGILTWVISFPAVALISQLADLFIYFVFHVENYEQVAVRFLKTTLETPSLFVMAMISIIVFAPLIEEFLFRGLLQTWIKRMLGTKAAILIASFCFAFFHLAGSQGIGNISLFVSLFALGCYLGFIYERQGSLLASISLHFTFNVVSALRIMLS
jgi:uncharacterized protein